MASTCTRSSPGFREGTPPPWNVSYGDRGWCKRSCVCTFGSCGCSIGAMFVFVVLLGRVSFEQRDDNVCPMGKGLEGGQCAPTITTAGM